LRFGAGKRAVRTVWRTVAAASAQLADELRELIATNRIADTVRPL
jgi:hypothetical protein